MYYFGLFNGYGGEEVSTLLKDNLHFSVLNNLQSGKSPEISLKDGLIEHERKILEKHMINNQKSTKSPGSNV